MKKWAIVLVFGIWGCDDSEGDFGAPNQLYLLADREVICPGQTTTLRLFSASSKQGIPISEFDFDPVPGNLGTLTPNGVFTAPANHVNSQITITGTFGSKTKVSTDLNLATGSSTPASLVKTPFSFYNEDEGRPFFFWPNGSLVLGTGRHLPDPLKKFEVTKYSNQGGLQWKKELGSGEAKFIEVLEDKIYVAGNLSEIGGAVFFLVMILDLDGNLVWEKKIPATSQHVFSGFQVDNQGNFYISTYTNGNSFVTSFAKFNHLGEKIWEKDPKRSYREIFIFPDGNLVVSGDSIVGWGATPLLSFFDQGGNLLKTFQADFPKVFFKGPDSTFGIATQISNPNNETAGQYVDLYNSQGEKVVSQKRIGQESPYSGQLDSPVQKKIAPAGFFQVFTDSAGEIHLLKLGFWGIYDFLVLDSFSGDQWIWWAENKGRTAEGVLYPLQILEDGENLILLAHSNGELFRFSLGKDYSFDDCLREPYWNKLEMF